MTTTFTKDPDATLDFSVDWSAWLDIDTIVSSSWTLDGGITLEAGSHTSTVATAWISGGADGTSYSAANRITTAQGRTDERTIKIKVKNQ